MTITREQVDALTDEDYERGRQAIEDALIEMRDARMFMVRGNGLVVREKDGTPSDIILMGPEMALRIGLRAIAEGDGAR